MKFSIPSIEYILKFICCSGRISKSDVLRTLAKKEKRENEKNYQIKNNKPPTIVKRPELPKVSQRYTALFIIYNSKDQNIMKMYFMFTTL